LSTEDLKCKKRVKQYVNKQIVKKEFGELGLYGKDDPNRNVVVCGHPPQERHIKI